MSGIESLDPVGIVYKRRQDKSATGNQHPNPHFIVSYDVMDARLITGE